MNKFVAFFYIDYGDPAYGLMAEMMVASVKMTMPDYKVALLTDASPTNIAGIDLKLSADVKFERNKLMPARMILINAFVGQYEDAQIILADPDILFTRPVELFDTEYDVGLTWRGNYPSMPFNTGIMTSTTSERAKKFWSFASDICQTLPAETQNWYGDQLSVALIVGLNAFSERESDVIKAGKTNVKLLPGEKYNFSPNTLENQSADILHLKGDRKKLMIEYFTEMCKTYMGINNGLFSLTDETVELLLLQRTGYNDILKNDKDDSRNLLSVKLTIDSFNEFNQLIPHLPSHAKNVLDIGCGLGGIDYFFHKHYKTDDVEIHLLDKDEVSENIYFGFQNEAASYNSLDASRQMLEDAGVEKERIHTYDMKTTDFPVNKEFDVIYSSLSWGFHYPIETYLNEVKQTLSSDGCLILDMRKDMANYAVLQAHFPHISVLVDTIKYQRVCARKNAV